jgi:hypothetical protein
VQQKRREERRGEETIISETGIHFSGKRGHATSMLPLLIQAPIDCRARVRSPVMRGGAALPSTAVLRGISSWPTQHTPNALMRRVETRIIK